MSQSTTSPLDGIGDLNKNWGICGFTSTFYVAWKLRPGIHPYLINASQPYSVLFEIVEYLEYLKRTGNTKFINDIEEYTKSFPGYQTFTCKTYRKSVYDNLERGISIEDVMKNHKFSIAMPPECVSDYCKVMWKIDTEIKDSPFNGNAIIGVKSNKMTTLTLYSQTAHYVYRHDNKVYSWGKCFNSIEEAGQSIGHVFQPTCTIIIK